MIYISRLYRWLATSPLTVGLLLLPIVVFFIYFFIFQYNIPWFDDFENIPFFLNRFLNAHSLGERFDAIVRPGNEHRIVYARLVVLGQYLLTGGLNFTGIMLWGNGSLVLMFYLIYRALLRHEGDKRKAMIGALPVSALLFSAQMYLMTFEALFTLQYLSIIMLVMLTLFVLATERPYMLVLAAALGMFSSFSMGNGLLVWPAGVAMLFIQRRWGAMWIWFLLGGLSGYLYFLGYPVQQGNADGFTYVMHHPLQTVAGFLILLGNAIDVFPTLPIKYRVYMPFVGGLFLLAGVGYWLVRTVLNKQKKPSFLDAFLFGSFLFLLATFSLFALFRIRFNFEMVVHLSYRIYALTLLALALVLLFSRLPETTRMWVWPVVWLSALGLTIFTYFTYLPLAMERRQSMQALTFNQLHNNIGLGGSRNTKLADYIAEQLAIMKQRGWYSLPDPAITTNEQTVLAPIDSTVKVGDPTKNDRVQIRRMPDFIVFSNDDPTYRVGFNKGRYLILKSNQHTYLMFAGKKTPTSYKPWAAEPGFWVSVPIQLIQPERYQIGFFDRVSDRTSVRFINQFVDIN